jgi:hypothetical protein
VLSGATLARERRRRRARAAVSALVAAVCLVLATVSAASAWSEQNSPPTAADRRAAASAMVARRWQTWPAGKIFPAVVPYTTSLLTQEDAARVAIEPGDRCAAALSAAAAKSAMRDGCQGAVRATYVDQFQGVVYTTGLLAFPAARPARVFVHYLTPHPATSVLLPAAFPGTASARFSDAARQAATDRQDGPYVLLTVAGYADGRPAAATGESRPSVFAPASQLASAILTPLNTPVTVNCASRAWSC